MISEERLKNLNFIKTSILVSGIALADMLDHKISKEKLMAVLTVARIITDGRPEDLSTATVEEQHIAADNCEEKIIDYVEQLEIGEN